jgi:hypothetical protein
MRRDEWTLLSVSEIADKVKTRSRLHLGMWNDDGAQ